MAAAAAFAVDNGSMPPGTHEGYSSFAGSRALTPRQIRTAELAAGRYGARQSRRLPGAAVKAIKGRTTTTCIWPARPTPPLCNRTTTAAL